MRENKPQPASRWALALLAVLAAPLARAELLDEPSVEQLIARLSAPALAAPADTGPYSKSLSFRPAAPPDPLTHRCDPKRAAKHAYGRNLVPYSTQAPSVDLALRFELGSDRLSAPDQRLLERLALAMQSDALRAELFAIAGHTDATGSRAINEPLSCARALAAREYLIALGIAAERLDAYGFGSERPIENRIESAANRRVEIRRGLNH